jgi:hypothetical protein
MKLGILHDHYFQTIFSANSHCLHYLFYLCVLILPCNLHSQAHYLGGKVRSASTVEVKNLLTRIKESSKRTSQNPLLITGSLTQGTPYIHFIVMFSYSDVVISVLKIVYTSKLTNATAMNIIHL